MKKDYREILNKEEAIEWIISNYENFIINNQNEHMIDGTLGNAVFCYTGSMSKIYNDYVYIARGNLSNINIKEDYFKDTLSNIKLIASAFSQNQIKENIILYHYVNFSFKRLINFIRDKDSTFCLNRFMSTTLLRKSNGIKNLIKSKKYNILFKLNIKKGTNCIPILWKQDQSKLLEYEIILEHNLNLKLRKIRIKPFSLVKCELEFDIIC